MAWNEKKKVTRRERFLVEMDAVIPWAELVALIAPHYSRAGGGLPPIRLETVLRLYFLRQWFDLSNPAAEDALYDTTGPCSRVATPCARVQVTADPNAGRDRPASGRRDPDVVLNPPSANHTLAAACRRVTRWRTSD